MLPRNSYNRTSLLIRNGMFALAGLIGCLVLIRLLFVRSWNYDELSHAHMAWLVSVGEVPYRDFAINHFPFFWIPVSMLMRILPENSAGLIELRGLALLLNAVFVGALATLIAAELPSAQRIWAVAGFGLVVFSPICLHFLIEFRPDALSNALLLFTIGWFCLRGKKQVWSASAGGFFIGAALLINTKYVMFPFILGLVAIARHARRIREIWLMALAICAGFGAAVLSGILVMSSMKISLSEAWQMAVSYNTLVEKAHTFGFGLASQVTHEPLMLAYTLAGIAGCIILYLRRRCGPGVFATAILIFLAVDLATSTRPWKQYVASWFLLAAYFPARLLASIVAKLNPQSQLIACFCIVAALVGNLSRTGLGDPNGSVNVTRETQDRLIDLTSSTIASDGYVVAGFPLHPVFRRDSFFKVVIDMTANGGDGLEQFMPLLTSAPYSEHFQKSGYEKELELRPPSLIVLQSLYTNAQTHALNDWLKRGTRGWENQTLPGTDTVVLVRKNSAPQ